MPKVYLSMNLQLLNYRCIYNDVLNNDSIRAVRYFYYTICHVSKNRDNRNFQVAHNSSSVKVATSRY